MLAYFLKAVEASFTRARVYPGEDYIQHSSSYAPRLSIGREFQIPGEVHSRASAYVAGDSFASERLLLHMRARKREHTIPARAASAECTASPCDAAVPPSVARRTPRISLPASENGQ